MLKFLLRADKLYREKKLKLKTVSTFASALNFWASHKAGFKCHARDGLQLTELTTLPLFTTSDLFTIKTYQKWFLYYHLSCRFKIFINVFAFLYIKANSQEICEKIFFPSFFRRMLCQH